MIGVSDIGNILYADCKRIFSLPCFQRGNVPQGEITTDRIIIYPKVQQDISIWKESFVEVNICVPDIAPDTANLVRLNEVERIAREHLKYKCSEYDNTLYRYKIDTIGLEQDQEMKCHYVNISILFETINTL
jgi:hypothetical protein